MSSGSLSSTTSSILNIVTTWCRRWQRGCGNSVDAVYCAIGMTVTPCAVPLAWLWRRVLCRWHDCDAGTGARLSRRKSPLILQRSAAWICHGGYLWFCSIGSNTPSMHSENAKWWKVLDYNCLLRSRLYGISYIPIIVYSYHRIINDSLGRSNFQLAWQGSRLQA